AVQKLFKMFFALLPLIFVLFRRYALGGYRSRRVHIKLLGAKPDWRKNYPRHQERCLPGPHVSPPHPRIVRIAGSQKVDAEEDTECCKNAAHRGTVNDATRSKATGLVDLNRARTSSTRALNVCDN